MTAAAIDRRDLLAALAIAPFAAQATAQAARGLVGDGRADDGPRLQGMIDAAAGRGGGVVSLPAGVFRLTAQHESSALIVPPGVSLRGAGRDRTRLVMAAGAQGHVVSIPRGGVELSDLTIDGNEAARTGRQGHGLRINGSNVRVERVSCINTCDYGVAIGQRDDARAITLRDVLVVNTGQDGIDIKNDRGTTSGILLQRVVVRGFGRPDRKIGASAIGTKLDNHRGKAGIDIRSRAELIDVAVYDVLADRDGIRFRPGTETSMHGAGGHGSTARNIRVRGTTGARDSNGIVVLARDVTLRGIDVRGVDTGLVIGDDRLRIDGGVIGDVRTSIAGMSRRTGKVTGVIAAVTFQRPAFDVDGIDRLSFDRCTFNGCDPAVARVLRDPRLILRDSHLGARCRVAA